MLLIKINDLHAHMYLIEKVVQCVIIIVDSFELIFIAIELNRTLFFIEIEVVF